MQPNLAVPGHPLRCLRHHLVQPDHGYRLINFSLYIEFSASVVELSYRPPGGPCRGNNPKQNGVGVVDVYRNDQGGTELQRLLQVPQYPHAEIVDRWCGRAKFTAITYDENMPVQDDARERQMISLFNLTVPQDRKRADVDAHLLIDGHELEFELKSTTKGTVSTVRDLGKDHITKWRENLHWIFAFYEEDGQTLKYCIYASPQDMEPWIAEKERYIRPDLVIADFVPMKFDVDMTIEILGDKDKYTIDDARLIMKNQWKNEQYKEYADLDGGYSLPRMTDIIKTRARYVIERGATLNNPHIGKGFFQGFEKITTEHASVLREKVRAYLSENAPATD